MKNVVLIIKTTLYFILSLLRTWKNSFYKKKEYVIIPASNLSIQTKNRRWKSISMHRNVRLILKMLAITGWNYNLSDSFNNKALIQKQLSWITAFLLLISLSVSAQNPTTRIQANTGNTGTGNATAISVTMSTAPVNGNTLIAVISTRGNSAGRVTGITQTGASWSRATQATNTNGTTTEIWYAPNVSGATTAISIAQANLRSAAVVMEYNGVLTASSLDKTANATGNSTAASTGTTATTAQANEVLIAGIGLVSSGYTLGTPANSFTSVANAASTNSTATNNSRVYALERIVTATLAASTGGTVSTSSQWSGAIATFKAAAINTAGTASSNPTLCINTPLTAITRTTTGATGIGTAAGLPAGVTAAWAANVLTISGTPTNTGTFNYTIPLTGGAGFVNATGTITVLNGTIDYANLQFPGSQTICIGNNLTAYGQIYEAGVTEAAGANAIVEAQIGYNSTNTNPNTWAAGNWTNATYNVQSGNNDEYAGTFGSALAAGTYYYAFRYRMNGCAWQYGGFNGTGGGFYNGTTNNNGVLTVSPNNTPGTASSTPTLCINTPLTNITRTTTGATGISNAGVSGANGLPAGVSASWASNVITISGTPTASGAFNYSIPLTGGCGTAIATGTITVTPANTATLTSAVGTNAQLRCINTAITNITYSTTGATGATFSGLPAGVSGNWAANVVTISGTPTAYGVYNYTVTLTGGCGSVTATGSINVNGLDYGNLQFPGTQSICPGNNFTAYGQVFEPGITEAAGANVNIVAQFGYNTSNTDPSTWPAGNWSATTYSSQSGNNDEYRIDFGSALASGTYYYTFRYAINGCSWQYGGAFSGFWNGTTQPSGVLTVNPPIPAQPAAIAGTATQCPALTSQTYSIAAVTNATTYNWSVPTGWNITAGAGTTSITVTTGTSGQNGNISVTAQNSCGTSTARTLAVTVSPATPAQPAAITGTATQCPALTSQTYSIAAVTNATTYNWSVPTGWNITAGAGTASITVTTGSAGQNGNISVTAQNSCGTSTAQTLAVTVSPATPATPGAISGTAVKCPGLTGQVYSISAVTNATSYNWTVPTGWNITAGAGTASITVTTGSAGQNGNISVTAQNSCGTSSAQTLAVTVSPAIPAAPVAAAGTNAACTSISANWSASANATAYFLDISAVNTFASFVTGFNNLNVGNVTTYSATGLLANTTYYYRVRANNSCGTGANSSTITYATSPVPVQPSTITGTLNPEIGLTQAYSVTNVAGVTYAWSFSGPNGWSVASGQGSNAIVANVGTANTTITVVPSNTCGNGTSRTIATTIPQYRARFISADYGTSPWCQGESRSISVVVKNTGVASWTNASPDVNIGAKWNTNGANWADYLYRVDANGLAPGAQQTYTFAAMQASNATVGGNPPTYTTGLNAGNNNITFDIAKEGDCWFGSNGGTCGPGNAVFTTPTIVISASAPAQPGAITGTAVKCPGLTGQVYSIAGVANASTYNWSVPTGWTITAGAGSTSITVTTGSAGQNGNISVTAQNFCGTSSANTLAVTVSPATPASPVAAAGSNTACSSISANWAASANATAYFLDVSTSNTFSSFVGSYNNLNVGNVTTVSVTGLTAGVTYYYRVRANNSCGTSASSSSITYATLPATPAAPATSAGSNVACTSISANWTASANATAYFLDVSTVNNFASFVTGFNNLNVGNVTTYSVTGLTAGVTYYYRVRANNSCGTSGNSSTITYATLPATPAQPGTITGTVAQCPALTSQTYSITAVSNATSYNWLVPTGWSITANTGTSITVSTGTAGQNGNISVTAQNSCGTSIARTLAVTVSPATPAVATAAAGTNAACTTISANWAASTNATAYFLDVSTVITFSSFVGAYNNLNVGNVNTLSVTGLTAGVTYFYRVRANNSCGTSASSSTITYSTTPETPAQPGTITGTTAQCAGLTGQVYSISAVANATTYNWTVPTGWTITAGAGTTSITVTAGAGGQNGNIGVRAQNSCGTSSERTLGVTVTPNPTVNVGAGLAAICAGGNSAALGGSVTSPATGGTWTSSAGGTFNPNATTLNATWTAPAAFSGTATLTLTSSGGACGTATGSKSITVNPLPANAGAISGTATVCQGQSGLVYSISALANATTYSWSYSGTGFTASGSTASIFGSFSASATSGNLTVRGVNACGNGVVSATYAITVSSAPAAAGAITGSPSLCQGQNGVAYSVAPIAGATSYLWSYTGTGFTPSGTTASITADFSASATAGTLTVRGVNSCGNGVASANYNISVAQLPGTPGTILGPSTVCKGQVGFSFTIPAIANATSYNWQYTGTGVTFSGNTNLVTITVSNTATAGSIRVRGVSACLNGPWSAPIALTIIDPPNVSITSNYCGNPGFVILTASTGFSNYLWNTGANTSFINADIAGQYTVTVANSFGCMATASVGVATELVTNGSFSAGNTGFTTNYTYVADIGGIQSEMYPEGTYAVVPNANTVHNAFWGTGHTPSGGPHMVVNGHPALGQAVWSQNSIAVQPNTTYYFSAWGLSVVNGNNAVLRFSINGSQVGTTAFLPNGYSSTAGPFNWVRFYGSWNSGFATTADLSIVNLNTILGGNDFGLDDISFGTLSPIPLAVAPSTILGTTVCQGNELVLNANAVGGASPFTYQWTGPNGFTSTLMNPIVTASASAINAGTYTLTVTDGFGCTATSNVVVTISALPLNKTPLASNSNVCVDGNSSITIASSQTGVSYQLRNDADDSPVGDPVAGTGGTISFPIDNLLATTTYNVSATGALTQCSVEMSSTVTITVATTPVLAITNQAVCSGTVDLTAAAVTAGSTGSGTLSYWTNASATTSLANPSSVAISGIYFIRSNVGTCVDIEPVSVSITTTPITGFTYPTSPYCSSELDPDASMNASAVAGVFTSLTAGLVFSNTATGTIDLSASTPGTYTVRNTVSPSGGCPSVSSTSTVVITGAPLTDFSYDAGNDFCQVYSAVNPSPVFGPGAAAGTFASTFGLNFISTSTGVVNLASSTPGNYAIWNTRPAIGGCASESDTVFIDINPYVFAGTVNTSVSDDIICLGETIDLFSQTTAYSSVLLREGFNGAINNWVRANSSVGGTVANATWTLRPNNYSYNSNSYRSNDNTQFYMSNSEAQAGTTTLTTLRSPVMSTVGYTNLSLDFFHYFNEASLDTAQVQVSLNNTTWTTLASYTSDQGNRTGFTNPVINLNAYIGQPIFYVRFRYTATNDNYWAIDNVSLTGNCTKYNYNWVSAPAGFSSTSANPLNVAPPQNSFYVVNATNTFGCSNPSSPLPITVNALPILTSNLTPPAVCGNELFTYVPTATPVIATIDWTRPATAGISNAAITAPQISNPSEILENTTGTDKNVIYNIRLNNNGCEQIVPVTVAVKPVPVVDIGSNLSVCNGSPAQLNTTVSNGLNVDSYLWSPATGLSSDTIADPTAIVPTASQNYSVTVQATNGCVNTSSTVSVTNVGFGGSAGLWLGTVNNNWDDCRNWADGKIPTSVTDVTLDGNALNDIQISGSQQCNNLLFLSNNNTTRTITLLANATLEASGNVAVAKGSGTGTITLRLMSNATLNCNNLSISGTAMGAGNAIVQKDMVNTTINVNGSLSIDPGALLDLNDNNNGTSEGTMSVKGNFVNNGNAADFNIGNVIINFNGSALQTITCPTDQDFGNITLDNSSVAGVKLNNNIKVSRGIQFVNGVIDLNQKTLTLGSSSANAVLTGSGNNSYILAWDGSDNGTVIQQVNNTGFNYLFPIGDLNEYTPFSVNLSSATLSNATLTAKLNGTVNSNIVGSTNYLGRFWSIEPSGITNPVYSVQYSYAAGDIVGSEGFLFPAKYNSGGWQSCNGSASNAMIGTGSVDAGTNTLSWSGITTFSEFTAIGNGSPLPIELLDFNAACDGSKVNLSWTTASESNNKQFIVEESNDAKNWVVVKTELGAGNSNTLRNYAVAVNSNYSNGTYYRLTQVDYNGDSETFDPIYVNCDVKVSNEVNIYPVPAFDVSNLDIKTSEDMDIQITLFSSTGQILLSQKTALKRGNNIIKLDIANLSPGMYHVNIVNDKKIEFSGSRSIIKR